MDFLYYLNELGNYQTEESFENINDGIELYFPPEVLYEVLKNLNVQDLGRAALVNKLWNETATRVQARRGPEIAFISLPNYNVYDSIKVKPLVAFMFVAAETRDRLRVLKEKVIEKYKDRFPYNFMTMGARRLMIDKELFTTHDDLLEGKILGLLIPEYRDLKVRVVYTQDLNRTLIGRDFLDRLLPEDSKSKITFIIFNYTFFRNYEFFGTLEKCIEKRQQKYSLWGTCTVDEDIFARTSNYIDKNNVKYDREIFHTFHPDRFQLRFCNNMKHQMFAMSITGSSLESWAIVIGCPSKKHEFHKKLLDFRNQLRLRRRTIGLIAGPQNVHDNSHTDLSDVYTDHQEMMHAVKTVFPDVSFIGIYNNASIVHGLKSKAEDPNQTLIHHDSLALMILTYD